MRASSRYEEISESIGFDDRSWTYRSRCYIVIENGKLGIPGGLENNDISVTKFCEFAYFRDLQFRWAAT